MQINTPIVTITESDFAKLANKYRKWSELPLNPLEQADPDKIALALVNSIEYILADRFTEGVGQGGWGHSDQDYIRCLYGDSAANGFLDSLMTTVAVVHALHDVLNQLGRMEIQVDGRPPSDLLRTILVELEQYLEPRWDVTRGYGGTLKMGRENDYTLCAHYRHTAWLFELWHLLPVFADRLEATAKNLLEEFELGKWKDDKVSTAVAAHSAFTILENHHLCKLLGDSTIDRVRLNKCILEGEIESQFSQELSGWTSGDNPRTGGRQLYTLFICAELADLHSNPESVLANQMTKAIEATMSHEWRDVNMRGVPLGPGLPENISATALAASALIRKPQLTDGEQEFLKDVVGFLIDRLSIGPDAIQGTFSWTLSYFLRDICTYLADDVS